MTLFYSDLSSDPTLRKKRERMGGQPEPLKT